MALAS